MNSAVDLAGLTRRIVANQLALFSTGWSIGVLGALAEFARDEDELAVCCGSTVVTARGAIALNVSAHARAIAYELPSAASDSWLHGVALCLPRSECRMHARTVVTEIGADAHALRPQDREAILFDLGLGNEYFDFYVRSAIPAHLALLRASAGRNLLGEAGLFAELVDMSPQRVFVSAAGRIEIYQPIGTPHGTTPQGPHTHLIPKLLRNAHVQSASIPVPRDSVVCAIMYPAHPLRDREGLAKPFDSRAHETFQSLLREIGDPDVVGAKQAVLDAVRKGDAPASFPALTRRHERLARRVAVRQIAHVDGPSSHLALWRDAFDPPARLSARLSGKGWETRWVL
jgi:uncharacterized protein DUF6925